MGQRGGEVEERSGRGDRFPNRAARPRRLSKTTAARSNDLRSAPGAEPGRPGSKVGRTNKAQTRRGGAWERGRGGRERRTTASRRGGSRDAGPPRPPNARARRGGSSPGSPASRKRRPPAPPRGNSGRRTIGSVPQAHNAGRGGGTVEDAAKQRTQADGNGQLAGQGQERGGQDLLVRVAVALGEVGLGPIEHGLERHILLQASYEDALAPGDADEGGGGGKFPRASPTVSRPRYRPAWLKSVPSKKTATHPVPRYRNA